MLIYIPLATSLFSGGLDVSPKGSYILFFGRYTSALQALSHALLLAPQNVFIFLQFAETAYTSRDIPLALKMFLVVIDMNDADDTPGGVSTRAWWGVTLVMKS